MSNYFNGLQLNPVNQDYSMAYGNDSVLAGNLASANSFSQIGGNANDVGGFTDTQNSPNLERLYGVQADAMESALADKNSMFGAGGKMDTFMGNAGKVIGGVSSLANIYLGFKQLDMAKQELGIKKDQWAMAKGELKHMQDTRKRIGQSYTGGAAVPR